MTKNKESEEETIVGIAWYRSKQWRRVRDISTDGDDLAETYEEWLRFAEEKLAELAADGVRVEKVDIDSEELIGWCNERGREIDRYARSAYTVEKLRERNSGSG
jgi:hypothetical protein